MTRLTKDAVLAASDLTEREVELPSIGGSVLIRSLPAQYSNQAQTEATEIKTGSRGEQTISIKTGKLEELKVFHAVIDPKFDTLEEVQKFAEQVGPAWQTLVEKIDEISGVQPDDAKKADAAFRAGGSSKAGADVGNGAAPRGGRPDIPARTGA